MTTDIRAAAARLVAARVAQGLPARVIDTSVLRHIAAIIGPHEGKEHITHHHRHLTGGRGALPAA